MRMASLGSLIALTLETMMDTLIMPCPFCGAPGMLPPEKPNKFQSVRCTSDDCEADGPIVAGRGAAIAAWNRRTDQELVAAQPVEGYSCHVVLLGDDPLHKAVFSPEQLAALKAGALALAKAAHDSLSLAESCRTSYRGEEADIYSQEGRNAHAHAAVLRDMASYEQERDGTKCAN